MRRDKPIMPWSAFNELRHRSEVAGVLYTNPFLRYLDAGKGRMPDMLRERDAQWILAKLERAKA